LTTTTARTDPATRRGWRAWLGAFFASDIGLKWMMALTGIGLLLYVLAHMVGNLKVFISPDEINSYGEALRDLGGHLVPRTSVLWVLRIGLTAAFVIHVWAALVLTRRNIDARGRIRYHAKRQFLAANYASRTMRWSGTILALFVLYHLADLTWGFANPDFVRGDVYGNLVASFDRLPVAILYIAAQLALALHIYHGAWSMFQSLGLANPRFNDWRRYFAVAFAAVILVGNVSIPLSVQLGIIS
jgi:succinate dehydrogenase / fumarate reductase cytochrome b subunit